FSSLSGLEHYFCFLASSGSDTFQVCRPIFVRLHFFKNCASKKLFTSPGTVVFADIVRLSKEPAGLVINITC
ncbi:hypothetical protein P2O52_24375, partial [Escherichia coli]